MFIVSDKPTIFHLAKLKSIASLTCYKTLPSVIFQISIYIPLLNVTRFQFYNDIFIVENDLLGYYEILHSH